MGKNYSDNLHSIKNTGDNLTLKKMFDISEKVDSRTISESVACREYILPRDEKLSDPKGWIRGNTQIGPVLEVTTSFLIR